MTVAAINVMGLTKNFGDRVVVNDLNLDVPAGQIMGFLGPNGSGKTTTLRMLCGLLTPDSGSGQCLGYNIVTEADKIKKHIGYMTQRFSLYEDLTIKENLEFIARIHGLVDIHSLVKQTLERLGLWTRRQQLTSELSGGWKQRLALAACILHQPKVLLLDEPTAGVDPNARREFWEEIHALAAEGLTVLVSTHYMDEAERCHNIAYIAYGRLLVDGTVADIINSVNLTMFSARIRKGASPAILRNIQQSLETVDGIDIVAPFGNDLHVGGTQTDALNAALAIWQEHPDLFWFSHHPSLEDAFIYLMKLSGETGDSQKGKAI